MSDELEEHSDLVKALVAFVRGRGKSERFLVSEDEVLDHTGLTREAIARGIVALSPFMTAFVGKRDLRFTPALCDEFLFRSDPRPEPSDLTESAVFQSIVSAVIGRIGSGQEFTTEGLAAQTGVPDHYVDDVMRKLCARDTDLQETSTGFAWSDDTLKRLRVIAQPLRRGATVQPMNQHRNSALIVDRVDVCIVVATEAELTQLKKVFGLSKAGQEWRSSIEGISVLADKAPDMGMAAAACTATKMLLRYEPRLLAMCGVAGGYADRVSLGTLVVAERTWDYTRGKHKNGEFLSEPKQFSLRPEIRKAIDEDSFKNTIHSLRREWDGGDRPAAALDVYIGAMVTGGAVVDDQAVSSAIEDQHRKILAVDMEACAVALAADEALDQPVPWLVVKGISDLASGAKAQESKWQPYCAWASAGLLRQLLLNRAPASLWK